MMSSSPLAQAQVYEWHAMLERQLAWPWWAVGLALLAIGAWLLLHELRGASRADGFGCAVRFLLRWFAAGLVFVAMLGWSRYEIEVDPPEVLICVDKTRSMSQASGTAGSGPELALSRLEQGLNSLRESADFKRLERRWRVRWFGIGDSLHEYRGWDELVEAADPPSDETSRLGEQVQELLQGSRGKPVAAVVLVTDGNTTEGPDFGAVESLVRASRVPFFPIDLSDSSPRRDLRLDQIDGPRHVLVGERIVLETQWLARGMEGESIELQVRSGDDDAVLASTVWTPGSNADTVTVPFDFQVDRDGVVTYRVTANVLPQDQDATNHEAVWQVRAQRREQRVLLVARGPSYEYRFLKHALERARRQTGDQVWAPFELSVYLQSAQLAFSEIDSSALTTFPVTVEQLAQFDAVVMIDPQVSAVEPNRGLTPADLDHLATYVRQHAGNLVFVAGWDFAPETYRGLAIEELLPCRLDELQTWEAGVGVESNLGASLTPIGRTMGMLRLSGFDGEFDWSRDLRVQVAHTPQSVAPGTRVLLRLETELDNATTAAPLLTLQPQGEGMVMFQGFAETYRLRYRRDDRLLGEYWSQWVTFLSKRRWLSRERFRELWTTESVYRVGDRVRLQATLPNGDRSQSEPVVRVWSRDGGAEELVMLPDTDQVLTWYATYRAQASGDYRAALAAQPGDAGAETEFRVLPQRQEDDVRRVDRDALEGLASVSGGALIALEDVASLVERLPRGQPVVVGERPGRELWQEPYWIGALGTVLMALILVQWWLASARRLAN